MNPEGIVSQFRDWFAQRVPGAWFEGDLEVGSDDQEILVIGTLPGAESPGKEAGEEEEREAHLAHIAHFREETRQQRIEIASEAERLFNRKVSWGARSGEHEKMFTGLGVPVMTRLRLRERALLDTLIEAGVARSRSEALAWCVALVAARQKDWIQDLRKATKKVEEVRRRGPDAVTL
jgi:hypothetical protein